MKKSLPPDARNRLIDEVRRLNAAPKTLAEQVHERRMAAIEQRLKQSSNPKNVVNDAFGNPQKLEH